MAPDEGEARRTPRNKRSSARRSPRRGTVRTSTRACRRGSGSWSSTPGGPRSRAAGSPTGGFELYNLAEDPLEQHNLAATRTEEVRRLRRDLVAWMRKARLEGDDEEVNGQTERALQALGYVN